MCLKVNSMQSPPKKEGEYLFYYGNSKDPYFMVDYFRFTVEEDKYESQDWYLEEMGESIPTLWFELPNISE